MVWDSTPGDKIGQGIDDVYSPANSAWTVTSLGDGTGIRIEVARAVSTWTIDIGAPTGEVLAPGEYAQVSDSAYPHVGLLDIQRHLGFCLEIPTGRVTVLELETAPDGMILRFAADIEERCADPLPALVAAIRYNSTIADIRPFGGDYPRYELSVAIPAHGSISGSDITCGGGPVHVRYHVSFTQGRYADRHCRSRLPVHWVDRCVHWWRDDDDVRQHSEAVRSDVRAAVTCRASHAVVSGQHARRFMANGQRRVYSADAGIFTLTRNPLNGVDVSMRPAMGCGRSPFLLPAQSHWHLALTHPRRGIRSRHSPA